MAKRFNLNRGEKALLICCSLFVVIVTTIALWWQDINATPRVTIPSPAAMPIPNARDFYIKAGNALVPLQVKSEHGMHSLGINDIASMIRGGQSPGAGAAAFFTKHHDPTAKPMPSLEELHELLSANAPAMIKLRQGFAYEYREKSSGSINTSYPLAEYRDMVNCLYIDAYMKRGQGDWNGAMNDYLDGLYFGEQIPHGSVLTGMLVGIALQAISRRKAWSAIDHLDAIQAHTAARRMEDIMRQHTAFADVLQEEKWEMQATWLKAFREPNWRKSIIQMEALISAKQQSITPVLAYTISKKQIMGEITSFLNAMIAHARQPYAVRKTTPLPKDPITMSLLEVVPKARFKETYSETQNCLLLVSLALRAYYLDHGQYPDSLTVLAPSYQTALPADPFAASGTLQYRRAEKGYLLYSLGPDGRDDHGTPCAGGRVRKEGETQFQAVDEKSTGDIVAGVNAQ